MPNLKLTFPDGTVREYERGVTGLDVAKAISSGLAREALADCANVHITSFSGLLVNFLRDHEARVVLRGVRSMTDFHYEFQMAGMNRSLIAEAETVFLTPSEQYMFVSASIVREIATLGGDVGPFVHPLVKQRLALKVQELAQRPG